MPWLERPYQRPMDCCVGAQIDEGAVGETIDELRTREKDLLWREIMISLLDERQLAAEKTHNLPIKAAIPIRDDAVDLSVRAEVRNGLSGMYLGKAHWEGKLHIHLIEPGFTHSGFNNRLECVALDDP